MQTSFEEIIDMISNMMDKSYNQFDKKNNEPRFQINQAIWSLENGYLLVEFPDAETFMDRDWFKEEAILYRNSEEKTENSAYFIPIKYLI